MSPLRLLPTDESRELADDIRELFADLAASLDEAERAFSSRYQPSLDVRETEHAVEVIVDVAGVPPEALRVMFRDNTLVIAGAKTAARPAPAPRTYLLLEREYGRFARVVQLTGAFDIPRAQATVANGELTIVLPKLAERRGRPHRIPVTGAGRPA